ncbi:NADH-quinone oxidoreductase subunit C [Oscillatoria amoena NRMC-F 0135]|nr:NADH-quinone oxidoreductase subunit C [Oscillatoria laete-virens]MDL5047495.1 NADH-quinone oxidoreductase subunit C [Oscillatoria amoena NRMC-F 0135]MDL5054680.1 NADH-quinone oxidoreductase subunit C [Oscillatoria laete-virens NRMC-F 0139]
MTKSEAADKIAAQFPAHTFQRSEFRGDLTVEFDRHLIADVCRFAKDSLGFLYLADITSVDNIETPLEERGRFEVVYEIYNHARRINLRLKIRVPEDNPLVKSVTDVWRTADWHEREIYDMMGIKFENHPDLRRILMWEGYPYFPLRKDFPLAGKPTELPDVAFSKEAPLEGGPFVTRPAEHSYQREPRPKTFQPGDLD